LLRDINNPIQNQKTLQDESPGEFFGIQPELVDHDYVTGLRTLGTLFNGEFDLLAFFKILEAIPLDRGEMYENIRAFIAGKKAVALAAVEPLDCT